MRKTITMNGLAGTKQERSRLPQITQILQMDFSVNRPAPLALTESFAKGFGRR